MPPIALITGASSGFGKACAIKFASHGYDLILNARRTDHLLKLSNELERKYNVAVYPLAFDVRQQELVYDSISKLPEPWNRIDVLVNNAGLAVGRDYFEEADVDDWNRMIDTNVKGFLYV